MIEEGRIFPHRILGLSLIVALAFSAVACNIVWEPRTYAVGLADLNGNGHLDAFVVNGRTDEGGEMNTVWFNDGTGVFTDSGQRLGDDCCNSNSGSGLVLVDLTGSGHIDAVVPVWGGYNELWINDGEGSFKAGPVRMRDELDPRTPSISPTKAVAAGDFTGNGHIDIVFGDAGAITVVAPERQRIEPFIRIWLNEGGGRLVRGPRLGPYAINDLVTGDLNGSGHLDLVVGIRGGSSLILFNDGRGNFLPGPQTFPGTGVNRLALGDLNGNGSLDLTFATTQGVEVWINDGEGQFTRLRNRLGRPNFHSVELADLNGDGRVDVFAAGLSHAEAWLNDGQGGFTALGRLFEYPERYILALGDLNGNGHVDVVGFHFDHPYLVWFNDGEANFGED
jgi:hypothetical protein